MTLPILACFTRDNDTIRSRCPHYAKSIRECNHEHAPDIAPIPQDESGLAPKWCPRREETQG